MCSFWLLLLLAVSTAESYQVVAGANFNTEIVENSVPFRIAIDAGIETQCRLSWPNREITLICNQPELDGVLPYDGIELANGQVLYPLPGITPSLTVLYGSRYDPVFGDRVFKTREGKEVKFIYEESPNSLARRRESKLPIEDWDGFVFNTTCVNLLHKCYLDWDDRYVVPRSDRPAFCDLDNREPEDLKKNHLSWCKEFKPWDVDPNNQEAMCKKAVVGYQKQTRQLSKDIQDLKQMAQQMDLLVDGIFIHGYLAGVKHQSNNAVDPAILESIKQHGDKEMTAEERKRLSQFIADKDKIHRNPKPKRDEL